MSKTLTLAEIKEKAAAAAKEAMKTDDVREKAEIFDDQLKDAEHRTEGAKQKTLDFFKALVANNETQLKDLSEGVDADGGYLVPTETAGQLIEKLYKLPVIRPYATRIPLTTNRLEMNAEDTTVEAYWTAELATITQSDPTFGQFALTPHHLVGLSRMSRQFLADANIAVLDFIIGRFAAAIGRKEDQAFTTGSGSGQPLGIRQVTPEAGQTQAQAGANLTADDLIDTYYNLPEPYRKTAVWLLNDDIVRGIRKLKDSDGQRVWTDSYGEGLANSEQPARLLGRPVLTQNDIPTNLGVGTDESEIYFADLSFYMIGDREGIYSEYSTQEGTSFAQHRAAVKVGERVDGEFVLPEALSRLTAVVV